jgi:hypothetical protein
MDATRHKLAKEELKLAAPLDRAVASAESLEQAGNWYLAGENYRTAAERAAGTESETLAKLLTRAAACFDVVRQDRAAARAYFDAASELHRSGLRCQEAGELFNRAALLFRGIGEYFNAGDSWRRAGSSFEHVSNANVSTSDNLPPVPAAAGKFTVAANCYTAGGDAFLLSGDEAMWACMAYWEAGRAHSTQGHGYHAFVAYRKALTAAARFYGTHDRDQLRRLLPLTEKERASKLDPLVVMEQEAHQGNRVHQQMNKGTLSANWSRTEIDRQLIAAYHEFYLTFAASGNSVEAGVYRAAEKERNRRLMLADRQYGRAALYWIWNATSGYGENLFRWAAACVAVLLIFSFVYFKFRLVEPASHWFDYFYFSIVTFTSLGYGDIHPIGFAGKAIACVEIVSGLVMFGLLLTFVSNRFQR